MSSKSNQMVTGVFRNRYDAERAFDYLHSIGYSDSEVNVLMSDSTRASFGPVKGSEKHEAGSLAVEGMGVGGAIGTAIGAGLAAIAAIGTTIAVPGLGLLIAGPIAAALAGGGAGAVTGGLIGTLVGAGFTEHNAKAYEEALRSGGIVIGVHARNSEQVSEITKKFKELNGEDVVTCAC